MDVVNWEPGYRSPYPKTVLSVGNFDGVHLGHRGIFRSVIEKAKALSAVPAVLTFNPHARHFFPRGEPPLITTFEKRMALIAECGIEVVFVAGQSREFYEMSARAFVEEVLVKSLRMVHAFVGHDFTFGKGRQGTIELLARLGNEYGFGVDEKSAVLAEGVPVSSTMVRNLVKIGLVADAAKLLGREFSVTGTVIRGAARRARLGYALPPTANIDYTGRLIPLPGVYVVWVAVGGRRIWGVASLGTNPTFGSGPLSLEVHILDFDGEIYGETVEVGFIDRIRDEIRFSGPEELANRIGDDIKIARRIIKDYEARL
jgi:riboflavin kinase/FMN adenylyltransferase